MAAQGTAAETGLNDALELGWRMAELYAQVDDLGDPVRANLLPAHDSLPRPDQLELQVRAAAGEARRTGASRGSGALEDLADQAREAPTSADNGEAFRGALLECHIALAKDLWAQHEAAGKAYELGNGVSDTFNRICRAYRQHAPGDQVPEEAQGPLRDEWRDVFREDRIERIKKLLDDLQSRLDPSGVAVVSDHLETWSARVTTHMERESSLPELAQVRDVLRRQTIIWRQLLAGAKQPEAYLNRQQRAEVPGELRKLLWRRLRSWRGVAIFAVVGLVVLALLNLDSVSSWFDEDWVKGLAGAAGGAAGLFGINRASAALAVRNRLSQWSQLLWNRALAKKVSDVTLTVDGVFPATDPVSRLQASATAAPGAAAKSLRRSTGIRPIWARVRARLSGRRGSDQGVG